MPVFRSRKVLVELVIVAIIGGIALSGSRAAQGQPNGEGPANVSGGPFRPTAPLYPHQQQISVHLPTLHAAEHGGAVVEQYLQTAPTMRPLPLLRPTRVTPWTGAPGEGFLSPLTAGAASFPSPESEWLPLPPGVGESVPVPAPIIAEAIGGEDAALVPWNDGLAAPPVAEPRFGKLWDRLVKHPCQHCGPLSFLFAYDHTPFPDAGLGIERVAFAPFFIDVTQPQRIYRMRFDSVYDLTLPDRAEAFWSRPSNLSGGKGPPAPELAVSYQDIAFAWELGNEFLSVATNLPIRLLDPVVNPDTAGLSDLSITTKLRLLAGDRWQITQVMNTTVNTGAFMKGLGMGHVALEPGLLFRYRWSDATFFHSEAKYWFAVGGLPDHAGQILRLGIGVSHVLYEHDTFAVMPTLEFVHLAFLDGQKTVFPPLATVDIDNEGVYNLHPGVRFAADTGGDLGIVEVGIASGIGLGSTGWWDQMLRIEARVAY